MSQNWVVVGFPIESTSKTHLFVAEDDGFVCRCDASYRETGEGVCELSEAELESLLRKKEDEFCKECVREVHGIALV